MELKIVKGDLTELEVDAIVNPANSHGLMGGGVAYAIKSKGGQLIEQGAIEQSPIPVGTAVLTSAGNLPSKNVIHAPTMENPAERIGLENAKTATKAALECAASNNIKSIAFPGMGTGVGGLSTEGAAEAMIEEINSFTSKERIDKVILIAFNQELFNAFQKWTKI
ncbi:macro domain-containing protein [Candidatus Altiarchaeota archaeon]